VFILSPDWIEAIASLLTLAIIIFLTLYASRIQKQLSETSIQAQRDFISREEAYRVRPILLISSAGIQKGTAYLRVENIGRGDAFDVNLNITLSKWLEPDGVNGQSLNVTSRRIPRGTSPVGLDTKVKKGDITENIDGDLIAWGNMRDEEERIIELKRIILPCETFLVHQHINRTA